MPRRRMGLAAICIAALLSGCGGGAGEGEDPSASSRAAHSPYAGEEERNIKSLSAEDVRGYLAGEGIGLALAAELNHYPGPRHVLDLADELGLSGEEREMVRVRFEEMRTEAQLLGREIVDRERDLDRLFADGNPIEEDVRGRLAEIGRLHGTLRYVHVREHLRMREMLTQEQVDRYDRHRGYAHVDENAHEHGSAAAEHE